MSDVKPTAISTIVSRTLVVALCVAASGCVFGAKLRDDAQLIEKKIANARERGAYRCAVLFVWAASRALRLALSVTGGRSCR